MRLSGLENRGDLVAVHTVDADQTVFGQQVEVGIDLALVLAATIIVVRGVADPETTGWFLRRWRRDGGARRVCWLSNLSRGCGIS